MMDETEADLLRRITRNPAILCGKPVVRGMRISVEQLLHMMAAGNTIQELLADYPFLVEEDLRACLLFGARCVDRMHEMPLEAVG